MDAPKLSTKNIWPMVALVVVFLIALWVAGRARTQEVILEDMPDGKMKGTIKDSWFFQNKTPRASA